ncbi:MAG TPA: hypothetical protein VGR22_06440 [Thermomicrobiales bacterium]|nr:hypothetical protein [Thermomicrobiales bacterium]
MTVPDYIISRTIAVEHQQRQSRHTSYDDLPEPRPRSKAMNEAFPALRRQIGFLLRVAADRIEPEPTSRHRSHRVTTHLQVLE